MGTPIRPEPQSLSELMGQREREREEQNPIPSTLRTASATTDTVQPTRAARVLKIQGETAYPTDFIDRNLDTLEVEVAKPTFDAERFSKDSPLMAAWLAQDPTRVAAARGRDIERLGRVEGYLKAIGTEFERNRITTQLVEPGLAALFGNATPEQEAELTRLRERQASLPDVLGTRGFVSGIPIATLGQLPITLSLYKGAAAGAGVGAATGAAVGAVRGAIGGPGGAATGAVTGGLRGAFVGSRVGVVVEGVKLEAANAFLDYRELDGVDRETAAVGALIAGTVSGVLELVPFENAAKAIPGLRRLGRDGIREMLMAPTTRRLLQRYGAQVVSQLGAEGLTEGLQELVQIAGGVLTERYAEGTLSLLSTDTILREIFSPDNLSRIAAAARTGAQAGGGFGAVAGGVGTAVDMPAVRRAERNAQRVQQAAEAIHGNDREEAIVLAKDAPEATREAVASLGSDGGYFDITELTAYWQGQTAPDGEAANPREVALALGVTPEEYDAAVESGAPINIPADRLLVDAMASPVHRQWFVDNLRVTPNELSKAEAMRQKEQALAPVADVADVAESMPRETEAEHGLAALRDRLTAELRQARVGPEEVTASVALWTEAAKTAIQRNPALPVAEVLRRFERVQVVARPVAAYPDGKAVSQFEVTGETLDRGDGTQVPVLKSTRTARANAARLESIAAEKGEDRLTGKQREQLTAARQALVDAEAVNKTLTPVDFAALGGPVDVQGMSPEQRAAVNVEANSDTLTQAATGDDPRGAFIAPAGRVDGPRLIALFKERNQTTFLHESAHAFLDLWTDLAADPAASPEFRELVSGVRAELGATEGERLSVAQEEQFAGLFLDYAKTGKAPSVSLRQAFASFAAFLTKLWSFVKGEIVPASENVRDLLDRLLATDDAIAEARGEFMAPLFPDDAKINSAFVAARTEAEEKTRTEAMKAVVRAEQEWWKRTERQVAEEVRERVNQDRDYISRQILTTGRMPNGDALPAGSPILTKLNRQQIVALIGDDATKALPRGKTGAVYNTQGQGLDLNIAAEALGYANGPALVAALQQTQPIEEHVANVTKATMTERYGDPLTEGTVPEVAVASLHNDSLDRMRQLEMETILRDHPEAFREAMVRAASRPVNVRELKEWAKEQMQNRPLKTIRPAEYLSAERRAGREAVRAVSRGEWATAVQAKAKQRYAAALYAEAVAAKEAVTKFQDLTAKVFGPDERIAKSRNLDIVMAARQLLASVGVGKREEDTQFYLAQLAEYDSETAKTLEGVVADFAVAPRNDFKSLTYAEFENVRSAVQELWDTAKQTETLTIAGRKIAKAEAVADLRSVLVTMKDSSVMGAGVERVAEWTDKANKAVLTAKASLRRVESWVDLMDGGNINGPFRRYIFATLRDRTAEKAAANTADLEAYEALLNTIRPTLTTTDIPAPELNKQGPRKKGDPGWVFKGKAHLLGTLLHTGNPSNLAMLLQGRGWTMDGWLRFRDRMVATGVLTPADFAFVQGVWNLFESKKPDAQKVYRRMFGRYFDEITREGFTIRFPDGTERTYAGGYTPATKDPDASTKAEQRAADAMLEEAYGMRFPTVNRDFTMNRVRNFEPLLLSLDIVPKHLDAVNKFIYLAEPVREVGRLLRDRELRAELDRVNPAIVNELLMPWLQRTATQVVQTPSATRAVATYLDPVAKYLRTTAGASFMFLNVANTLEQATGLSTAAVRVNPKYLSLAQAAVLTRGEEVAAVVEQNNPFMRERTTTQFTEVRRRIDTITTDPNVFQRAQSFMAEHAYVLQSLAQAHIDRIVWYGSYLESLDAGLSVSEARAKANADVRLTQGSFEPVDVARIETGNVWWRLVAMFAGYFNMLANLNATEMQKAVDTMGLKKSMPRLFAVYALGFAVPILGSNLIRRLLLGREGFKEVDGDDEWGYLDDFFAWFFGEQFRAGTAMAPAAGQTLNYMANLFDEKAYNDQLTISPALSFIEASGRGVKASYDLVTGESFQRRDIRDMLSLFSLMSRIPATGAARPLTYLYDVETGRTEPSGPIDFTRGLLGGR